MDSFRCTVTDLLISVDWSLSSQEVHDRASVRGLTAAWSLWWHSWPLTCCLSLLGLRHGCRGGIVSNFANATSSRLAVMEVGFGCEWFCGKIEVKRNFAVFLQYQPIYLFTQCVYLECLYLYSGSGKP